MTKGDRIRLEFVIQKSNESNPDEPKVSVGFTGSSVLDDKGHKLFDFGLYPVNLLEDDTLNLDFKIEELLAFVNGDWGRFIVKD